MSGDNKNLNVYKVVEIRVTLNMGDLVSTRENRGMEEILKVKFGVTTTSSRF